MDLLLSLRVEAEAAVARFEAGETNDAEPAREALQRLRRGLLAAAAAAAVAVTGGGGDEGERAAEALEARFRAAAVARSSLRGQSHAEARAALFRRDGGGGGASAAAARQADLLAQNKEANASWARTRSLLMRELQRVGRVNEVLREDAEKLRDVSGEYANYAASLKTSSALVANMKRRDQTDNMLLGLGLAFFFLVVLYILRRRLGPILYPLEAGVQAAWSAVVSSSQAQAQAQAPLKQDL